MFLQYSFAAHHLESEDDECDNGASNTCVDFVRLRIPTYQTDQITCGTLDNLDQLIAMDGLTSLTVEFVTNRATEAPGVNLHVYCRDPAFDVHVNDPLGRRRRNIEDCTSPNGDGPRDEPFDPPPVSLLLFHKMLMHKIYHNIYRHGGYKKFWTETLLPIFLCWKWVKT